MIVFFSGLHFSTSNIKEAKAKYILKTNPMLVYSHIVWMEGFIFANINTVKAIKVTTPP